MAQGEAAVEVVRVQKFGVYKTVTDSSDHIHAQKTSQGFENLVRFPRYDLYGLTDTVQYAFLVVTPQSQEPHLILCENGKDMEKQLKIYRNHIQYRLKDETSYEKLIRPLAEYLQKSKVKKVYFSPDGLYHQLNPKTLLNPQSAKYLGEEFDFQQVTNTKDILNQPTGEEISNQYAVLLGNPEFEGKYKTLPATKKEVENIQGFLKEKNWDTELRQGKEATENVVKELFKPKVLHIATHGYFEAREETVEDLNRRREAKQVVKFNPLWRSGLILSKSDRRSDATDQENPQGLGSLDKNNDDILTAYEVMNLNLDGTDLVVLSACETGLGEVKYGEGVYGLQRAFKVAGAKNVVMSLWKVDDEITQELMTIFYAKFAETGLAKQSFEYAQAQIRKKYPEPYYWGAFVMVGE